MNGGKSSIQILSVSYLYKHHVTILSRRATFDPILGHVIHKTSRDSIPRDIIQLEDSIFSGPT